LPGERLRADGASTVELLVRADAAATLDVVLVTADDAWRAPLAVGPERVRRTVRFDAFRPDSPGAAGPIVPRFLRVEAPAEGLARAVTVDLFEVAFPPGPVAVRAERAALPAPPEPEPELRRLFASGTEVRDGRLLAGGDAYFPFGVFLLGGNRTLLEPLGEAGANAVVEYGTATWPLVTVEDHLDYAACAGIRVGAALTAERSGAIATADVRLAPLYTHPSLLAWYLFDEPDGAPGRGVDAGVASPAALLARRDALPAVPSLVVCVHSFGLGRYAGSADLLATDTYWPALGRERSMAIVHADAGSAVEIAERAGAVPLQVLQLSDPIFGEALQTPATLRAQVLGSVAAGIRGILLFQGAATARLADEGAPGAELWAAFLDLASDVATWSPLAARWERDPGAVRATPELGEVRAACFAVDGERWVVVVNLGREPADVDLAGDALAAAARLEDPLDGWVAEIAAGRWTGRLAAWEGHVARVVPGPERRPGRVRVTSRVPSPGGGRAVLRFDRAVLGATLVPAPAGAIELWLDGRELDGVRVRRGASAVVRRVVHDLSVGGHTVELRWREGDRERSDRWFLNVGRAPIPFLDRFERDELGDAWGVARNVVWKLFDPEDTRAAGDVRIEGGELHVVSTGGSIGAVLRKLEAPAEFALGFTARVDRDGAILVKRNELFRSVPLSAGTHEIVLRESGGRQRIEVDGRPAGEWAVLIYHRGGEIGLGVPGGGEAWLDDVTVQVPPTR